MKPKTLAKILREEASAHQDTLDDNTWADMYDLAQLLEEDVTSSWKTKYEKTDGAGFEDIVAEHDRITKLVDSYLPEKKFQ